MRARAIGEEIEILPAFTSASWSPTIWYVFIDEDNGGTKFDCAAGELGDVDDFSTRHQILKLADAAFIEALLLLGGVIFGVFRKVAMRTCLGDRFDDARPLFLLAPAQLFLESLETSACHRHFVHHLTFSCQPLKRDRPCRWVQKENGPAASG
jgi:hypothetical protein